MTVGIIIGAAVVTVVAFVYLIAFALCRVAADADRREAHLRRKETP